ncbi:MAG TPA: twin-arginine translocase TatA/TatE family subunit [Pyrinomonadaceae bacterium]|jgi:TatA/E family protein of Tat protein translocase
MHCLLLLESIGTSELLVVLGVALVVFGPRKLPELGRSLGRTLRQVQAASDDFKRTWETEARAETVAPAKLSPPHTAEAPDERLAADGLSQESQTCLPT